LQCRNCGEPVDPQRVELGYDYCLKEECQRRCLRLVRLAAVGVNKAADYYQRADEVLPPAQPAPPASTSVEAEDLPPAPSRRGPAGDNRGPRPKTTLERLRDHEKQLDEALNRIGERFEHGEITASEMGHERDRLIEAFNRLVRAENIRYRSLLRRRPAGTA
jgi:hypothetical protein